MRCREVRKCLSEYLDGELAPVARREVSGHIDDCHACAEHLESLVVSLNALRALPRLQPRESLAARVLNRLEVESRGPGLALLFRPAWMARPLIFPSLVPAALVLVSVLAAAFALDHTPGNRIPVGAVEARVAPSGTEANPLFPSADVSVPRVRDAQARDLEAMLLAADLPEGSVFAETIVARDGSVADVKIINGETHGTAAIVDLLRRERFEPGRRRGRPVAVAVYRLISHMEVRASTT